MDEDLRMAFSEEHRRISQSFRAAKPLLSRKRPPIISNYQTSSAHKNVKPFQTQQYASCIGRSPLSGLSTNSTSHLYRSIQSGKEILCSFSSGRSNESKENKGSIFCTPPRDGSCSLSCNLTTLDDYFDESSLEQIDALCQHSTNSNSELVNTALGREASASDASQGEIISREYLDYIGALNERQQEAVYSDINTPLVIVAGPGSGKTSTMVGRVLMLLTKGISPSNILAMTFTTAAASEMRDRIGSVSGKAVAKEISISTFHSFSLHLCRSHAEKLNRTSEFLIYGHGQQRRAIIEAVRLYETEKGKHEIDENCNAEIVEPCNDIQLIKFPENSKRWEKFVTKAKASGKIPLDYDRCGDAIGGRILQNYNNILESCDALDYHDLISSSLRLLTDFPDVFHQSQESWKAIVVDEFQDTSTMQYNLLKKLASHNRITIVGDEDQSIFSFNGADSSGFDSFRNDFSNFKEVRLNMNYRSTKCIVEAASYLIRNNRRRCSSENVQTDNSFGSKVIIKECHSEDGQCSFVIDKILEATSKDSGSGKCSFGSVAVLYRRQVSGKIFQTAFRVRKIPFNIHGVAFYRKKVVKAIISLLKTSLPGCDDCTFRRAIKALLPLEKEDIKRVIYHVDKVSTVRKCSFITAASDIFNAKISGTFKKSELTKGRKVLSTLEMISRTVQREESISTVISLVANILPQKCLLDRRAVVDSDGRKLLNEDLDLRSVLQYLLDDVSEFLSLGTSAMAGESDDLDHANARGCTRAFIDYISDRERKNFQARKHDNKDSVTLTTIHQSKGLEWDTVFIVKANESEIPLLHESEGYHPEDSTSIEEERRLLYVAMTRARKKLFIVYQTVDSNWKMLQPSRFLKELPDHLKEVEVGTRMHEKVIHPPNGVAPCHVIDAPNARDGNTDLPFQGENEIAEMYGCNNFLKQFIIEERGIVSHLFHKWARKEAFKDPKRLVDKVRFVVDERLTEKKNKHKNVLRALKLCLNGDEALQYAEYVLRWEQIPADRRAHIMKEKEEYFQKLRIESAMGSSSPTTKQIAFLKKLGCTVSPSSRLHASHLIEQYKTI